MEKILKPYTIIPKHLYVNRNADRQICDIITDMGRPGYVLVSRQMGKTNLLLNAKRELGNENDKFIYVDLSNVFDDEKSCFQNIIDLAIETNDDYEEASKIIFNDRKELNNFPPHKQHLNELRILLKFTKGKLIIILDEIDALTKTSYSDKIFAQIRSVYFSRVNFPELENLTYILSGVVEPSEIIKDPKISPFNIGEKIFLNDFSKDEFLSFLKSSKLDFLPNEVIERIFYWTNGNPRITWDLCSEIENNKNGIVTELNVDEIVQKMYLTSFDKPPIDNIRELVKKDREIRNSIVELEYNKGNDVSDKIKSKLYLSGIINYEENDIHIKNEIIRQSLNLDWIKKLEEEDKGLIILAYENYRNGFYKESLKYFEKFLENDDFPDVEKNLCYHYMGYCVFLEKDYDKAVEYLNNSNLELEVYPTLHFYNEVIKGMSYKILENYIESEKCYSYVIENSIKDANYLLATLDLGYLVMNGNTNHKIDYAIELFENIVLDKFQFSKRVKEEKLNFYKSSSYYNLAYIYKTQDKLIEAEKIIQQGLLLENIHNKSSFLFLQTEITEKSVEKLKIFVELIELLLNNIEPELLPEQKLSIETIQIRDVLLEIYSNDKEVFKKIIEDKILLLSKKSVGNYLYDIAVYALNKSSFGIGTSILNDLYESKKSNLIELDANSNYMILKLLSYFEQNEKVIEKHIEYVEVFKVNQLFSVDYIDMHIFSNLIYILFEEKRYSEALEYADIINSLKSKVNDDDALNYFVIYNLELNIYAIQNNVISGVEKARTIVSLLNANKLKKYDSNLLGEKGLEVIKENATSYLDRFLKFIPRVKLNKKINRNDIVRVKYNDGKEEVGKFKKLEKDIYNGNCILID